MAFTLSIAGVNKTGSLKAKTLKVKRSAEGRNDCSFSLISPYATYSPAIGAEVVAWLDDGLVFGGVIKERTIQRLNNKGVILSSIKVTCQGYNHIAQRCTIQYQPNNVTAGNAVKYIIENALSDEGITEGIIEDGITLYNYDGNCKSASNVLDDLAESCGFKWFIDDAKALHFLKDQEITLAPFSIVETGGAFTDFTGVEVTDTLEGYRNKQFVKVGDRVTVAQNDTEIAARAAVEGGSGIYSEVEENSNVQERDAATALAEDLIFRFGQHIPATVSFITNTWGFDADQRLTVNLPSYGASGDYLIEQVDISDIGNGILQFAVSAVKKNFEKSTKRKENWLDYFQNIINEVKAAKRGTTNVEGVLVYSCDPLVINTELQTTLNLSPEVSEATHLFITFTITGSANIASQLSLDLQYDGETVRTYKHMLTIGYNTLSINTIIPSVKAGGHSVKLVVSTDSGTVTVAKGEHEGYVRAVGMAGLGTSPPEAYWVEPVSYVDVSGGRVLILDYVSVLEDVALNPLDTIDYIETAGKILNEILTDAVIEVT